MRMNLIFRNLYLILNIERESRSVGWAHRTLAPVRDAG